MIVPPPSLRAIRAPSIYVSSRSRRGALWQELAARKNEWADAGIKSVTRIGDCLAPGIIAAANYSGHSYAREFGETIDPAVAPFRREDVVSVLR